MAERISLTITCGCGAILRMSTPKSGWTADDNKRTSEQARVAETFLATHQCCGEAE